MTYELCPAGAMTRFTGMLRRDFLATFAAAAAVAVTASWGAQDGQEMYGQIGKLIAVPGKRDELIANILGGVGSMPGCLSYVVAKDASNADAIWVSEVWDSKASHDASLSLPSVKAAITKSLPIIAGSGDRIVTVPVGGQGLGEAKHS
jgi:quinol monooxygenase YgiN